MKQIDLSEKRIIQLDMLKEIDVFCREHNIRYSLAFGTLLGAIRHKGFIPWDDDVDIMMPLPDLIQFKNEFKSDQIEYLDVWNNNCYDWPFSRLAYRKTYSQDGVYKSYGICIDLYIMIGVPSNESEYKKFFKRLALIDDIRDFLQVWNCRFRRRFSIVKQIPGYTYIKRYFSNVLINHSVDYKKAKYFYNISGPIKRHRKYTYDKDLFSKLIDVDFEDNKFLGFANFDYYLTCCYGDYMQLPPEDQRYPYHSGKYYWKEDVENGK